MSTEITERWARHPTRDFSNCRLPSSTGPGTIIMRLVTEPGDHSHSNPDPNDDNSFFTSAGYAAAKFRVRPLRMGRWLGDRAAAADSLHCLLDRRR